METAIVKAACAIGAGIAMGFGAIGPAVGEGNAVGKALEGMARPAGNGKPAAYQHDPWAAPLPNPPAFIRWLSPCCYCSSSDGYDSRKGKEEWLVTGL